MDLLTIDELKELLEPREGLHVSIFMPTEAKGQETQQNPIRFKNLLNAIEQQLAEKGMESGPIERYLARAYDLLSDHDFWQHQSDGLAVFSREDLFMTYRLPVRFHELALVNNRFVIKPLLPMYAKDGRFYILALSQQHVRLLECSRYTCQRVELRDVPQSLDEILSDIEEHESVRYHTGTSRPGATRARKRDGGGLIYHGQGAGEETQEKVRIAEFFNLVDRGVRDVIEDGANSPLVLAGVEYLHAIYEEQSEYPNLLIHAITGNPEALSDDELHERAWEAVEPMFAQDYEDALTSYEIHAGRGDHLAAHNLESIVSGAVFQRIAVLFVASDREVWGKFNPDTGEISLHRERSQESDDLLDLAAAHTLLNGGEVYALDAEDVPGRHEAAAVLRF